MKLINHITHRWRHTFYAPAALLLLFIGTSDAAETTTGTHPQLVKECIQEPVFASTTCIYRNDFDAQRKTIILIHGVNGSALENWGHQIAPLLEQYNVLLPDLPGFGSSSKPINYYTPDDYVKFIHFLSQHYTDKPFYLIGHSLGGAVALLYSANHPENVERILVSDVAGILHKIAFSKSVVGNWVSRSLGERIGNFFAGITGEWIGRIEGAKPADFDFEPERPDKPGTAASISLIKKNFAPYLPLIRQPTLILWKEEDHVAPLRTGRALAARLPHAYLDIIPGKGHVPMNSDSSLFNQKMLAFLNAPQEEFLQTVKLQQAQPVLPHRNWEAECDQKRNMVFEGDFETLKLNQCMNIKIINSNIRRLAVFSSRFEIINSKIDEMEVQGSEGSITASEIIGTLPVTARRSRLDFAGVLLRGEQSAVYTPKPSELVFSISELDSPVFKGPVHDLIQMEKDQRL